MLKNSNMNPMTFNELREIYTRSELSSFPGDAKLRKEAFSLILSDLYENKVIYQFSGTYVSGLHDPALGQNNESLQSFNDCYCRSAMNVINRPCILNPIKRID